MTTQMGTARPFDKGRAPSTSTISLVIRYIGLAALNAMGLIFIYAFLSDDNLGLAAVFAIVTVFANIVVLVPSFFPVKWMAPGLMMMMLFVLYPVIYTVITAFTNYGDNHLLTKIQLADLLERRQFVPEDARLYNWDLYQNGDGNYAVWLSTTDEAGNPLVAFAPVDAPIEDLDVTSIEPPEAYDGYRKLSTGERTQALSSLQNTVFGTGEDTAAIAGRRQAARPLVQRFVYQAEQDAILDQQTDTLYVANDELGYFIPEGGTVSDALTPGFRTGVGLSNFTRLYEDASLLGALVDVFVWTVAFAVLGTLIPFAFGLFMALVLDHPFVPFRRLWRSLIFIPYAIPGVISILVWRGLLNQNLGLVTNAIVEIFGVRIPWFTDPTMAKVAILIVNLWLGYPYMMLICSGALQAIPSSIYEAAAVDGAKAWHRFWRITLPMLLVSVGPMLIASFTYNFNNYILIELLTEGNPPIPGTSTPAGYTDILINYTYNLAFGTSQGADYGYASAITIVIFAIVLLITLFNYRFVAKWEEVGESV